MTPSSFLFFFLRRLPRRLLFVILLLMLFATFYIIVHPLLDFNGARTRRRDVRLQPPGGATGGQTAELGARTPTAFGDGAGEVVDESFPECRRPKMDLWHPAMKRHFVVPEPLHCDEAKKNWVQVENGTFRISENATERLGKIVCECRPIERINDNLERLGDPVRPCLDQSPIVSDFFEARCISYRGKVYRNLHAGIRAKPEVVRRAERSPLPAGATGLNVLMFGFDSVSRLNWIRNLPKSHAFLTRTLGAVVLNGYNIVGDGTPQALLPILTGRTEQELPEARRGFAGANAVDGHPWIWRRFARAGYVTQWGEDGATVGTFNYRMLGFDRPPVDHYWRPYQHLAETKYHRHQYQYCMGSEPRLDVMLSWIRDLYRGYPGVRKFSFLFHSEYSHNSFSTLSLADETLRRFLADMHAAGFLNQTLLILMADHGARFADVRQSQQGKYEERLPYFAVRLPAWFSGRHPEAMANLRTNADRLTTPFDVHATFEDVLNYTDPEGGRRPRRGVSLFRPIARNRTCRQAAVAPHWCTCLEWLETSPADRRVQAAARQLVRTINQLTAASRPLCAQLSLRSVAAAMKLTPNEKILKFKRSLDNHGRQGDFSDDMAATTELYQVTIVTRPGDAMFEATVVHEMYNGSTFTVDTKEVSRINRYGAQADCITTTLPHLRPYCYCKNQKQFNQT